MPQHTYAVLFGSHRSDRAGSRAVRFARTQLEARGHHVEVLDALELKLPMLDRMYKEYSPGEAPENLERVAEVLKRADGFVLVAGEYNHGVQPGLKNLLDHFLEEWFWRPSAIVCYSAGRFAGVRAAVQLRVNLTELGMPSISSLLPIAKISDALTESGDAADSRLEQSFGRFCDELEWYAEAMKRQRSEGVPF